MTSTQLSAISGVVLSLLFSYVPGLKDWWGPLDNTRKRLIMAGMLALVAIAAFALSCGGVIDVTTCNKSGAIGLIDSFIAALVANQATYLVTPTASSDAPVAKPQ